MFVTFYAYKGGVGRTLALANIACLLAEDEEHPQKVLLWDFDLEAPGLHRLFPPKQPHNFGFVDLVYRFTADGKLPSVTDYVYESGVKNIHVLPAGRVDGEYVEKLQELNWAAFFPGKPEDLGPLFDPLVKALRQEKYDYILIDSRTGLNDQAGICTQVLPDLIVMLFRLNDQNLDGLEHLVPAVRAQLQRRGKAEVTILPIASAVTATSSPTILEKRNRVLRLFSKEQLDSIRFDPDLINEERLFSQKNESSDIWPTPVIVGDYANLARLIRRRNPHDTKTALQDLLQKMSRQDAAAAAATLQPLLESRPRVGQLWQIFDQLTERAIPIEQAKRIVDNILQKDIENGFAYRWKANWYVKEADSPTADALQHAKENLQFAIKYLHGPLDLHRMLAKVASCRGEFEEAVDALRVCHDASPQNAQILLDLAFVHIRMGTSYFAVAIDELEAISEEVEAQKYAPLAYLRAFLNQEEKAERALAAVKKMAKNPHTTRLVEAHLFVLRGAEAEGRSIAEEALAALNFQQSPGHAFDWAEFFICSEDYDRAREVLAAVGEKLHGPHRKRQPHEFAPELGERTLAKRDGLDALAAYLKGDSSITRQKVIDAWTGIVGWSFRELVLFRERIRRSGKDYGDRLEVIEWLVRGQELAELSNVNVLGSLKVGTLVRRVSKRTVRRIRPPQE